MTDSLAPPGGKNGWLRVVSGNDQGKMIELSFPLTTVGRGNDQMLVLADIAVSRCHIEIRMTETGYVIKDLNTSNGTQINNKPLRPSRPEKLVDGDQIKLGDSLLRFGHQPSVPLPAQQPLILPKEQSDELLNAENSVSVAPQMQPDLQIKDDDNKIMPGILRNGSLIADGRFEIMQLRNYSTYGMIYEAINKQDGSTVSVHVLVDGFYGDWETSQELLEIIQPFAAIIHPNLEPIKFSTLLQERYPAIISNSRFGHSLTSILMTQRETENLQLLLPAVHICQEIGSVLHNLHERGIFNIYMTTDNIILTDKNARISENCHIVLRDIAACSAVPKAQRFMAQSRMKTYHAPQFFHQEGLWTIVAPELFLINGYKEKETPRADVFALASIFCLIVLRWPRYEYQQRLPTDSFFALLLKGDDRHQPWHLPEGLQSLQPVLGRALAWNPTDRYTSIPEFLDALMKALYQSNAQPLLSGVRPNPRDDTAPQPKQPGAGPRAAESPLYVLPALPPIALVLGAEPQKAWGSSVPMAPWSVRVLGSGVLGLGLSLPLLYGVARGALSEPAVPLRPEMVIVEGGVLEDPEVCAAGARCSDFIHVSAFAITITEVTKEQIRAALEGDPEQYHPIGELSSGEAARYCNRLSQIEGLESCYQIATDRISSPRLLTCLGYRLPTPGELLDAEERGVTRTPSERNPLLGVRTPSAGFRIARRLRKP